MLGLDPFNVRTIEHHLSPSCRFHNVVSADGFQRPAAKYEIPQGIEIEQHTHFIHQNDWAVALFKAATET